MAGVLNTEPYCCGMAQAWALWRLVREGAEWVRLRRNAFSKNSGTLSGITRWLRVSQDSEGFSVRSAVLFELLDFVEVSLKPKPSTLSFTVQLCVQTPG